MRAASSSPGAALHREHDDVRASQRMCSRPVTAAMRTQESPLTSGTAGVRVRVVRPSPASIPAIASATRSSAAARAGSRGIVPRAKTPTSARGTT